VLEIPIYYVLRASDLARGLSITPGSYRFADHIYRGEPSGRGWFGRWLDARLLAMPAARSFRNRFLASAHALADFLVTRVDRPVDVLSAPCGLPRELVLGARLAVEKRSASLDGVAFTDSISTADLLPRARAFALDPVAELHDARGRRPAREAIRRAPTSSPARASPSSSMTRSWRRSCACSPTSSARAAAS
jgi:hypothetical protein